MLTAREKGRRLELILGGGDDSITLLISPVPAKVGAQLLADYTNIAFGAVEGDEARAGAETLAQTVLGPEAFAVLDDLRWAEQELVINAAFFWNVQGGSIDLVNQMLSEGLPKAREALLRAMGLWDVFSLQRTLLDSASERLMNAAASSSTATPNGS